MFGTFLGFVMDWCGYELNINRHNTPKISKVKWTLKLVLSDLDDPPPGICKMLNFSWELRPMQYYIFGLPPTPPVSGYLKGCQGGGIQKMFKHHLRQAHSDITFFDLLP